MLSVHSIISQESQDPLTCVCFGPGTEFTDSSQESVYVGSATGNVYSITENETLQPVLDAGHKEYGNRHACLSIHVSGSGSSTSVSGCSVARKWFGPVARLLSPAEAVEATCFSSSGLEALSIFPEGRYCIASVQSHNSETPPTPIRGTIDCLSRCSCAALADKLIAVATEASTVQVFPRSVNGGPAATPALFAVNPGHPGVRVTTLAFTRDGGLLLVGHSNGLVRAYDGRYGTALSLLTDGGGGPVLALVPSPLDDGRVICCSADGMVRVYDMSGGATITWNSLEAGTGSASAVWNAAWSFDSSRIAAVSENGSVAILIPKKK